MCKYSVLLQHVSAMIRALSAIRILGSVTAPRRVSQGTTANAATHITTIMVTQLIKVHATVSTVVIGNLDL